MQMWISTFCKTVVYVEHGMAKELIILNCLVSLCTSKPVLCFHIKVYFVYLFGLFYLTTHIIVNQQ